MTSRMEIDAGSDVCTDDEQVQTLLPQSGSTQRRRGITVGVAITLFAGAALLVYSQKAGLQQLTGGGLSALTELSAVGDTCLQKEFKVVSPTVKNPKCISQTHLCGYPAPKIAKAMDKCCSAECKAKFEADAKCIQKNWWGVAKPYKCNANIKPHGMDNCNTQLTSTKPKCCVPECSTKQYFNNQCLKDAWKKLKKPMVAGPCLKHLYMCNPAKVPAGQEEAAKKVQTCCKDSCEADSSADWAAVHAIFKRFDADGDDVLKQEEYKKYLKGIHAWGVKDYTDQKWDQGWKKECKLVGCTNKGITLVAFKSNLYGKIRVGMGRQDLHTCTTFSSESCASFKCPSKTFLRPQSGMLWCPISGCNKYHCCLKACEEDTDPQCASWTKQKGECTKAKTPWPIYVAKVCPKSCGAKGCPIPLTFTFGLTMCPPGYEELDSEDACKEFATASRHLAMAYTYDKAAKGGPAGCVAVPMTKKVYFNGKASKAPPLGVQKVCRKKSSYYKEVARAQKMAFKASCASFTCPTPSILRLQANMIRCPVKGCKQALCCLMPTTTPAK